MSDLISRADVEQTVEDNILCYTHSDRPIDQDPDTECHKAIRIALGMLRKDLRKLPSVQPFHNITMNDVLEYIDSMPEDVWQEFTACLECRGWELQRRTAKRCGSEFA